MILIGAEIIFSNLQQKKYYSAGETVQNIYFTLLNAGLDGVTTAVPKRQYNCVKHKKTEPLTAYRFLFIIARHTVPSSIVPNFIL